MYRMGCLLDDLMNTIKEIEKIEAVAELREYKATGLTPDQIREIDHMYSDICRANSEKEKKIEELKKLLSDRKSVMNFREYQRLARRTSAGYLNPIERLHHAVFGLNAEAGEVAGILQKKYQGHPIVKEHLIKELGDCLWMIAEACDYLEVGMDEVASANIEKLKKRYPDGFSAEKSLHRKEGDI